MDGFCFQSGSFRHSLGSSSCRGCQQNIQSKGAIGCDDTLCRGSLSCTGTTGQYQDFRSGSPADGLCLHPIIFHIYNVLNLLHINRQLRITGILSGFHERNPKSVRCRFCGKLLQFICNTYLRKIKRRQVNTFFFNFLCSILRNNFIRCKLGNHNLLTDQFFILQHLIHGHNDAGILCLQKL